MPQTALKYEVEVMEDGRVELHVRLPAGAHVTVYIIKEPRDVSNDLLSASQSSLEFWDNSLDDEDWNDHSQKLRPGQLKHTQSDSKCVTRPGCLA